MKNQVALLALAGLIATAIFLIAPESNRTEFDQYKLEFARKYTGAEENYRRTVYEQNVAKIQKHNADRTQTYQMGVNQFTDMTEEEFNERVLMKDLTKFKIENTDIYVPTGSVPNGLDWRTSGAVSHVKNQGQCGSCWSFSTTGLLESSVFLKRKSMPDYSEQQLVDCCGKKGFQCQGCNGAWPEWAMNYIAANGIVSESAYPYRAVEGSCQVTSGEKILPSSRSWTMVNAGDTNALKSALSHSPVSICVDATKWSPYKSGVFNNCGSSLDHAVLLVGLEDSGNWIVKNSWGTSWGEQGFIRLAPGNTCGLANHALIANLA